ncbi:DUF1643 domain-containing protein [Paenibacillus sp. sgz302251]|uniref:DUF1643 domain-containing protein n=1 Tax=Paenibacillus sp. sgz302251 TaxID=3414493 RepID=UPI003C7C49E3
MRSLLSGIVELQPNDTEHDFRNKLLDWIAENGWTFNEVEEIMVPSSLLAPDHVTYLGSAVFHPNYPANLDPQNPDLSARRAFEVNRRYFLRRIWAPNRTTLAALMMNPSAADELCGDDTIDFLMKYAKHNGYGKLLIVNTSPVIKGSNTTATDFPPDDVNWFYIKWAIEQADEVVLGWGENGRKWGMPALRNNYSFAQLLEDHLSKLRVFGYVDENSRRPYPKHPHPQKVEHRFGLDHLLLPVTIDKLLAMLLDPR